MAVSWNAFSTLCGISHCLIMCAGHPTIRLPLLASFFTLYFLILIIKKEKWLTQNSLGDCICFWNWRKNMLILVSLKSTIGLTTVFSLLLTEADFRCPGPICCDGQTIVFLQHFFSTFHHPFIVDTNSFQTRSHPRAYVFAKELFISDFISQNLHWTCFMCCFYTGENPSIMHLRPGLGARAVCPLCRRLSPMSSSEFYVVATAVFRTFTRGH